MRRKVILILAALALFPGVLHAQWRAGVNIGAAHNEYSIDKQYMTDYVYRGAWGISMGVVAQYDYCDWFGIRAELNITERNYRHTRAERTERLNALHRNSYLLIPVMGNFSFGNEWLRGFVNLGLYGGYWMSGSVKGKEYNSFGRTGFEFDEEYDFYSERDCRVDLGYAGGFGLEWWFAPRWVAQLETRCHYSVVSSVRQYMDHVKDYRYNTTVGLQAGVCYLF